MTGKLNPVGREPVLIQALATIVVWAATRYGLQISDETALQVAGVAFVILAPFVRQLVRPVAKEEAPLTEAEVAHARELLDARERLAKLDAAKGVPPVEPPPPPGGTVIGGALHPDIPPPPDPGKPSLGR